MKRKDESEDEAACCAHAGDEDEEMQGDEDEADCYAWLGDEE